MATAHTSPAYVECAALSNFTFLEGGSHPEELVTTAIGAGLSGLAITDRNSVAGVVRAHGAIADLRRDGVAVTLRYHPGCRLAFADGTPDILVHPRNRVGWGRLCRLLTLGNRRAEKGQCTLTRADVLDYAEGLAFAVLPADDVMLTADAPAMLAGLLGDLAVAAPGHVRLAARMAHNGLDRRRLGIAGSIADAARVPLLAVNDVLYHAPMRRPLQDILTSIRHHTTLEAAGRLLQANAERHIKSPAEMVRLFRDRPAI
jgi:error-prone DNA polymerase